MRVPVRALLAALVAAALLAPAARAELPRGPPPIQGDCLGWQGPGLCVYNIGYIEFRLGKRVLHVGDTVTGTYSWGLSETRSGRFLSAGEGLRLQRCSGDRVAALGSSGSRTCTWKAVRATAGWVTSLGMTLFQNASLGAYTENDFYVVLGREMVIEGEITRERTENNPTASKQGVPNVPVKIHGSRSKTVRTNANGYYVATVGESGRYRVTPELPRRFGGRRALTPSSRVVAVSRRKAARADFKVDDDLEVTLSFDRDKVPATGLELVTGTIRAERFGAPVPGLVVSLIPFRRVAMNPETAPVPAHICEISWTNFLKWPSGTRGVSTNAFPFDLVTTADGTVRFAVQLGTVPGTFELQAWAKDDAGRVRLEHVTKVSDTATIANEATGALGPGGLTAELATVAAAQSLALPTNPVALSEELARALGKGLAFAPVRGSQQGGVLVHPAGERPSYSGADGRVGSASGLVLPAEHLNVATATAFGGFAGAAKAGQLPPLPGFAAFAAGAPTAGWNMAPQDGVVRLEDDLRGWRYLGFPYPKAGGC